MHKYLIAALVAAAASSAHAEANTWNFTYTGFHEITDTEDNLGRPLHIDEFVADKWLQGSFTAEDSNKDGVISLSEVSQFQLGTNEYTIPLTGSTVSHLTAFSFQPNGKLDNSTLDFKGDFYVRSDSLPIWGNVTSGDVFSEVRSPNTGAWSPSEEPHYYWTPETRFAIAQDGVTSPVPEPASGAMAAAGVLLLAGLGALRKRR